MDGEAADEAIATVVQRAIRSCIIGRSTSMR